MRLFFALLPTSGLARQITDWRDRHLRADGRPVPIANLHMTLAFLGEVRKHRLEQLCDETDELVAKGALSPGELHLDTLGYWPKQGIFWLGASRGTDSLAPMAARLQSRGTAVGGRGRQGQYRPHITLFRHCIQPPAAPIVPPSFHFGFNTFALLESRNEPQGVRYYDVANWQLCP